MQTVCVCLTGGAVLLGPLGRTQPREQLLPDLRTTIGNSKGGVCSREGSGSTGQRRVSSAAKAARLSHRIDPCPTARKALQTTLLSVGDADG